jgi:hypothetical protein
MFFIYVCIYILINESIFAFYFIYYKIKFAYKKNNNKKFKLICNKNPNIIINNYYNYKKEEENTTKP